MPTSYDLVPYLGGAFPQSHPERLATLARLFGMSPVPVEHCRVLEIACGDGANIIPMALGLPHTEFLGIDLAERPIAEGNELVEKLGLTNITLRAMDLMDLPENLGAFDYIIAHGLYAWIPLPVRDKLMALCKSLLKPQGVAYISYNVFPGAHLRRMLREMMQYHVHGLTDPQEIVTKAFELLNLLGDVHSNRDAYHDFIRQQIEEMRKYSPFAIYHDDLAEHHHPVYFHEFAAHARRHGLQYLAEAHFFEMQERAFPGEQAEKLRALSEDRIVREQYLDFAKCRAFRQTLLCHDSIQLAAEVEPRLVKNFYCASQARKISQEGDVEEFAGTRHSKMKTAHPLARAILTKLSESWPCMLSFDELPGSHDDEDAVCQILFGCYSAGLVDLHSHRPSFQLIPGERPTASPLARLQAQGSGLLTTMRHSMINLTGPLERRLIFLLDGTRTREDLVRDLAPLFDPPKPPAELAKELETSLSGLGRLALLTA